VVKTDFVHIHIAATLYSIWKQISSLALAYTTYIIRGPTFIQYGGIFEESMYVFVQKIICYNDYLFLYMFSFPNLLYRTCTLSVWQHWPSCPGLHFSMFLNFIFRHLVGPFGWRWANHNAFTCAAHRHKDSAHIQAVGKIQTHNRNVWEVRPRGHWSAILRFSHYKCNAPTGYVTEIDLVYVLKKTKWLLIQWLMTLTILWLKLYIIYNVHV
jgi:hypothetical protein